jgi:ribA/ribD-fused uncharacterized protein
MASYRDGLQYQRTAYDRSENVVFFKTNEEFGGLSNMASGFPLEVNGVPILTSEALYQACRFPHKPDLQREIISQKSPMAAKMKSKPHRRDSRPDWNEVRVDIMRWCLRVKLVQNWEKFSHLLLKTGDRPIVEQSLKDDFWGAKPVDEQTLYGVNILGQLLMELREEILRAGRSAFLRVEPLSIPDFLLYGKPIQPVTAEEIAESNRGTFSKLSLTDASCLPLEDSPLQPDQDTSPHANLVMEELLEDDLTSKATEEISVRDQNIHHERSSQPKREPCPSRKRSSKRTVQDEQAMISSAPEQMHLAFDLGS